MTSAALLEDSEFDLDDFFTTAARRVQGEAGARGVMLLFDYEGPLVTVRGPQRAMAELMEQVLLHSLWLAPPSTHVFLRAQVDCSPQAQCAIDAHVVGSAVDAWQAIEPRALQAMSGLSWTVAPPDMRQGAMARGHSAAARASVTIHAAPSEGTVVRVQTQMLATGLDEELAMVDAHGIRAWLIADPPFAHEALARRLQRLGWTTTQLCDVSEALQRLPPMDGAAAPALVVASQQFGVSPLDMTRLMRSLPPTTLGIYTMPADAPEYLLGLDVPVELHTPVFAPRELTMLTLQVLQRAHPLPTGDTQPAPLGLHDRRHVLVVEDNPVNQILAREMVQLLGFEVDVVADGAQALEYCRCRAPHAVLMDINMPGMDGFEATRRLRELQRDGVLPHFSIVAATASNAKPEECMEAGMDGFIAKPLNLTELGVLLRGSVG